MGKRANPFSKGSGTIRWGVARGSSVIHDTRVLHGAPSTLETPGLPSLGPHQADSAGPLRTAASTNVRPPRTEPNTPPGDLARSRRQSAPQLQPYTRGNKAAAVSIAADPALRSLAIASLESQRYATTARSGRASRALLWQEVVLTAKLGDPNSPTADMVFGAVAILRAAGYRSAVAIADQAVLTAKLRDITVPPAVNIALRDARRASQRGQGPPRKSEPVPVERLIEIPLSRTPAHADGPLWPRRSVVIASWWLLREIEMSSLA
jgi:hypothetical protein